MELPLFKDLRLVLLEKNMDIIVGDLQFSNSRILQIWEYLQFGYVSKMKEDLIAKNRQKNMGNWHNNAGQNASFGQKEYLGKSLW
jgi:hypothetical protein